MTTATALGLQVALRVNDASQSAITAAQYLSFVNMAIDDLSAAGWLMPQSDDTSISLVSGTYNYTVPAGFAYIRHLHVADPDSNYPSSYEIPFVQWELAVTVVTLVDTPQIKFWPDAFDLLVNGRTIRIRGQKRPTGSLTGSETLALGMEAFIRERATAYAAEYLASGSDELAQHRAQIAASSWAKSQVMLAYHPQEFRVKSNSRVVPGR